MSAAVVLTLAHAPDHALVADCIAADRFASCGSKEIAELPVVHGGRPARLGDFFQVKGERVARVRIAGDLRRVEGIGAGMAGGELVIEGSVGRDLGRALAGGTIDVRGDAGDNAGGALPGASRGMTGGEIVIRGSAGADAGARMRRGLVVVTGAAAERAGHGMIAGTVLLCGTAGRGTGRWTRRGTIVALAPIERPATFRYACTYRPPHLRLLFAHLARRHDLAVAERYVTGRYDRYSGDLAELGKGEILQWAGA